MDKFVNRSKRTVLIQVLLRIGLIFVTLGFIEGFALCESNHRPEVARNSHQKAESREIEIVPSSATNRENQCLIWQNIYENNRRAFQNTIEERLVGGVPNSNLVVGSKLQMGKALYELRRLGCAY